MKIVLLLFVIVAYVECYPKKIYAPIDKHANVDFINMEGGGGARPGSPKLAPATQPAKPAVAPAPQTAKPAVAPVAPTQKPVVVTPKPVQASQPVPPTPAKPSSPVQPSQPKQIQPKPVNPHSLTHPVSTPGPGSVKQLVNFYDSQGKGSPIRPYSYSQAVKQG